IFLYTVLQHAPEEILALDPVPSGLLYMMGLSSLGYLGGKFARAAGPIINEISIVPAESDQTLLNEGQPLVPNLSLPLNEAEQAKAALDAIGGVAAKPALDALATSITALKQSTTLAGLQAARVTLAGQTTKADEAARAAAEAVSQPQAPPDAVKAAQTAQGAAAALQKLSGVVNTAVAPFLETRAR